MPTYNRWRGDAQPRRQVDRIVVSDPEVGDTFTVTCNRKDIWVTVEDDDLDLPTAIYSRLASQFGGSQSIAEFKELIGVVEYPDDDNSQPATGLLVYGPDDGKPFTITVGSSDVGSTGVVVTEVTTGKASKNEIQRFSYTASGGTYTLEFDGQVTAAIAYNANAATIQTALEALSNIAPGDVTVSGTNPFNVEFTGIYAQTDVSLLVGNGTNLTGAVSIAISEVQAGYPGLNSIFRLTWKTASGSNTPAGSYTITFNDLVTFIPFTASPSDTQAVLQATLDSALGAGNSVVTGTGGGGGYFDVEFTGIYETQTANLAASTSQFDLTQTQAPTATPVDEKQAIQFSGTPTGGTFQLSFRGQVTAALAYNISAADLKTALELLSTITTVTVTQVTSKRWSVEFDDPGSEDLPLMTVTNNSLTGVVIPVSVYQQRVVAVNEVQQVSIPRDPASGTFTLTYAGQVTAAIAFNASAATVQAALEALSNIAPGDVAVTGAAGGPWLVTFGGALAATDVALLIGDGSNLGPGAGTQTISVSAVTIPTGPAWVTEPENWSLGTLLADGEYGVAEDNANDMLYGLDQMATVTPAKMIFKGSYTGKVGLPDWTGSYIEYRPRKLRLGQAADAQVLTIEIGDGAGEGPSRLRLDTGDCETVIECRSTASPEGGEPVALDWVGTHASNKVRLYHTQARIAGLEGELATIDDLQISYNDNVDSDVSLLIGSGVTIGGVTKAGGFLDCWSSLPEPFEQLAGETSLQGAAGATDLKIRGGTFNYNGNGTLVAALLSGGGMLDFSHNQRAKAVTNPIEVYGDVSDVVDPHKVAAPMVIDYNETTRSPNLGRNFRITRAATA